MILFDGSGAAGGFDVEKAVVPRRRGSFPLPSDRPRNQPVDRSGIGTTVDRRSRVARTSAGWHDRARVPIGRSAPARTEPKAGRAAPWDYVHGRGLLRTPVKESVSTKRFSDGVMAPAPRGLDRSSDGARPCARPGIRARLHLNPG